MVTLTIVLIIIFALAFSVANGRSDAANSIATVISTRTLSPLQAVIFGAIFNLAGALFSSEVANTIGREIADLNTLTMTTFLAAAVVAPIWITFCTTLGLPISCSHSLMGGLIGAVMASLGHPAAAWADLKDGHPTAALIDLGLKGPGVWKIMFGAFIAPIAGFICGYLIILAVCWGFRRLSHTTSNVLFGKYAVLRLVSAGGMAFAHGTGDAQKAMGLICGAMVVGQISWGWLTPDSGWIVDGKLVIPFSVRLACALTMALGTALGGWAVIRTLGTRLANLKPHQGFAAETSAATVIMCNTLIGGIPISTTHAITGSVMGVGAAKGVRAVKWGVGKKIIYAWVFTFPVCIVGGALLYWLFRYMGLGVPAAH